MACACLSRQIGFVLALEQITPAHRPLVGAKAVNLARMLRAGLPVPGGFCLTARAFERFVASADCLGSLASAVAGATAPDRQRALAAELRQQIASAPVPVELQDAIARAIESFPTDALFAVRSSAACEDLPDASFAGQHDSSLNVRVGSELLSAVRGCYASLFSDRALLYRLRNGIAPDSAAMAVIIQQMVPAQVAGVIFTADPASSRADRIVIEAAPGLGDALISGRASPQRFILDNPSLSLVEPPPEEPLLRAEQVKDLARLALAAERLFESPQDLEFAIADERPFLLQSRPITTLTAAPTGDVWSNANTGELLPEVATPMTFAILRLLLEGILNPILRRVGIELENRPWFDLIAGRVYMNVTITAELMRGLPVPGMIDVTQAFGGGQAQLPPHVHQSRLGGGRSFRLRTLLRLPLLGFWALRHSGERAAADFLAEWRRRIDHLSSVDLPSLADDKLAHFIPELFRDISQNADKASFTARAIGTIGIGMGCAMILPALTRRWLGDEDAALASRLLAGAADMVSAQSAMDLYRLADFARRRPPLGAILLERRSFAETRAALGATDAGRQFLERWDGFMATHGHHARGEVDVHIPRWSETPDFVLDTVRNYLRLDQDVLAQHTRRLAARQALLDACNRRLRNPVKRWVLNYILRRARGGLTQRENVKSQAIRLIALIRRGLLEAGRRLASRGVLADPDDIFFMTPDQLPAVFSGQPSFDVRALIAQRRAEYAWNQTLTPPTVMIGRYDPAAAPHPPPGAAVLSGIPASPGLVTGPARVILHADADARVLPGEILVAPFTDPGWAPYFLTAAALVTDLGGLLSHGSIIAREYGLPAVVNTRHATRVIRTGQIITVDAHRGAVTPADPATA